MLKRFLLAFVLGYLTLSAQAQLSSLPSGGNKVAMVGEQIGLTQVTIHYNRPGVKGREGKIYGTPIVHTGFQNLGFGSAKEAPWRAGANENTTIEFADDVMIEGKKIPAGLYGLFVAYQPEECTVIFSTDHSAWGSYFYNPANDALRVKVKPVTLDKSVEWLQFRFMDQTANSATIGLEWEKLRIPFTVTVDYPATQIAMFRKELVNMKGFRWESWEQAASWCLQNTYELEQGLQWSDSAISPFFGGNIQFSTWATRAGLLEARGRSDESKKAMETAMGFGTMNDLHNYGRSLLSQQKNAEAMEVFQLNYKNHPKEFTTLMGMARGYSAAGDFKKALRFAKQAQPLAPDEMNKEAVDAMIGK